MKEFLYKISFYFFSILLTLIIIIFLSFEKKNSFLYDKYQNIKFDIKNLELAIYGDSHIKGAIDTKIISNKSNKSITHFSSNGMPLYYSVKLAENHIKINPKIKCIIDLGTNNIEPSFNLEAEKYSYVAYMHHLSKNYHYLSRKEVFYFFKKFPIKTIQSVLNGIFSMQAFINTGVNQSNKELSTELKNEFQNLKIKYDLVRKTKRHFQLDFELSKLNLLIENNPQTRFLLIRPPEHQLFLKMTNVEARYLRIKNDLKKFSNVTFLDFGNIEFKDSLFSDYSHLNSKGRIVFTKTLLNDNKFQDFIGLNSKNQ